MRTLLNIGSGPDNPSRVHPHFSDARLWRQVRVDIDPSVRPDVLATGPDLSAFASASVDAVWSSHHLEHLYEHDVERTLSEMRRVLMPTGFAILTTPDLAAIAALVVADQIEDVAYTAPAGPVAAIDMIYGYRPALRAGRTAMAHRTGFTVGRLHAMLARAGFDRIQVQPGKHYDLWAAVLMPEATAAIQL